MNNLEKLIRYLVKENDYKELVLKTGIEEATVKKFTMDVFARIIPSDFNKAEGSHIDEKDLIGIVNNFNAVVKEDSLKQLIATGVKKYGLEVKGASGLLMAVLPIIHTNIQRMTNPTKVKETKKEEKAEADKILDNIASRANEEVKAATKEDKVYEKPTEEAIEPLEEVDDEKLSTLEKVCIYIVLACLIALIITFVGILVL